MRFLVAILFLLLALPAHAQQGQGMSKALVVSSCSSSLPVGAVTNLTMDPQGKLCLTGISGTGGCAQATNYLARTVGGNEGGNPAPITALICGLVTDGVITGNLSGATGCGANLDVLYILAQQNSTDALLNLCGTSYGAGAFLRAGIPTPRLSSFTSYRGYTFSGSSYLDTNFNAATATTPKFTQNSASFGFWSVAVVSENLSCLGNFSNGSSGETHIYNDYPGSLFYARLNNFSVGSVPAPGTAGLFVGDRPSSATVIPYWNGVAQASQAATSQAPANGNFHVGGVGTAVPCTQQIAEAHIGASLGATLNLALYTRIRTYNTAVGIP